MLGLDFAHGISRTKPSLDLVFVLFGFGEHGKRSTFHFNEAPTSDNRILFLDEYAYCLLRWLVLDRNPPERPKHHA